MKEYEFTELIAPIATSFNERERNLAYNIQAISKQKALDISKILEDMNFILCPKQDIIMGTNTPISCKVEGQRMNESPQRLVKNVPSFYIARHCVTNAQYEKFDPRHQRTYISKNDKHPVICTTYGRALGYAMWLSKQTELSFRLPYEPEMIITMAPNGWDFPYKISGDPERKQQNVNLAYPEKYPEYETSSLVDVDDPDIPRSHIGMSHPSGNISVYTMGHYKTIGHFGSDMDGSYCVVVGGNFRACPYGSRVVSRGILDVTHPSDCVGIRLLHPNPMNYVA